MSIGQMTTEEELRVLATELLSQQHFNCLAVGALNFHSSSYFCLEIQSSVCSLPMTPPLYYDLASLTKPLTLSSTFLQRPEIFDEDLTCLLNHQGGLPSWGRLPDKEWREQILSYPIKKSPTLYSDFSALRLMLELEKITKTKLKHLNQDILGQRIQYWGDLNLAKNEQNYPATGTRRGKTICGIVHDDNAFTINEYCSHAGLFARIDEFCQWLLEFNKLTSVISRFKEEFKKLKDPHQRFVMGFDRVLDPKQTLAGMGAGPMTFGHLGFTGTSFWIDAEKEIGHVIFTNATKKYWHDRTGLNDLRRKLGTYIWEKMGA